MFQKWYQLSLVSVLALTISVGAVENPTPAKKTNDAAKAKEAPASDLVKIFKEKYGKITSIKADFAQTTFQKALSKEKKAKGKTEIKKPGKFKWIVDAPDASTITTNGKKFWYYTPPFDAEDKGQLAIKSASEMKSEIAFNLLTGKMNIDKEFSTKNLNANSFEVTPKKKNDNYTNFAITADPSSGMIQKLIINYTNGNITTIEFSNVKLNEKIDDKTFNFDKPKNTVEVK